MESIIQRDQEWVLLSIELRHGIFGLLMTATDDRAPVQQSAGSADSACTEDIGAVDATLNGDQNAYQRIVSKYQAAIAQQMQRFSRQPLVIEELVHDVFVEAFLSLKSYRSTAPLLHWLRKIAVRVGYRFWSTRTRERKTVISLAQINEGIELLGSQAETSSIVASDLLGDLLSVLGPRDRLVLTLLYWDGCSVAEASELAGWTQTMVKVQAYRARKRLKQLLEESK
ncbi:MAG: RNA polymerase sigma factor [Pirellulaceae bacterium]|nr:RNA polymerase sigma factor [Pirellulaceae bacterium]